VPIPAPSFNTSFDGIVGCVAVLAGEGDTPPDVVAKVHATLNNSIKDGLNGLLPTLGPMKIKPTDADIQPIKHQVKNAIKQTIEDNLSTWEKLLTAIGIEHQDELVGALIYRFSTTTLVKNVPPEGTIVHNGFPPPETKLEAVELFPNPNAGALSFTFSGNVIADPLPLSLKRVIRVIGNNSALGVLRLLRGETSSVLRWVEAVR